MPVPIKNIRSLIERWLPTSGFCFDRPVVLLQSDDWGRVGLRDREGLERLQHAGLTVGEHPYDLYTLETAEDLAALADLLKRHCDSEGNHPCLEMNFLLFNLDFEKMAADSFREIHLLPLSEGLPAGWNRPGLFERCKRGIEEKVFQPALHGTTHFCRAAVQRILATDNDRAHLVRTLWRAGTPYIYWRMPWIGYEYWDGDAEDNSGFLSGDLQRELIGAAVGVFARMFTTLPRSACAPGYRANEDTRQGWAQHGIHVAQNGPAQSYPPHFDRAGVLQLSRTVEFEPAIDAGFSVSECLRQAETAFNLGVPAIVSVHSINFHSTVKDFRSRTLESLDQFFTTLESKYPNLLYLRDEDLYEVVNQGCYQAPDHEVRLRAGKKTFSKAQWSKQVRA